MGGSPEFSDTHTSEVSFVDFSVIEVIHCTGLSLVAKCKVNHPRIGEHKEVFVKVIFDHGNSPFLSTNCIRRELHLLTALKPHVNLVHPLCSFAGQPTKEFVDKLSPINQKRACARKRSPAGGPYRRSFGVVYEYSPSSLADIVVEHPGSVSPSQLVQYVCDVCDGVRYLHNHRVTHFDLKLDHVLVSRAGRAVIADLGYHKLWGKEGVETFHAPGVPGGDNAHHAPDVVKAVNELCAKGIGDVGWSVEMNLDAQAAFELGVLVWEMLSGGMHPYGGGYPEGDAFKEGIGRGDWAAVRKVLGCGSGNERVKNVVGLEGVSILLKMVDPDPSVRSSMPDAVDKLLSQLEEVSNAHSGNSCLSGM